MGLKACSDAILAAAKRTEPKRTRKSLARGAEANAGKGDAKGGADAVEQLLLLAMTKEVETFEADLAAKLGPEQPRRLTWAPETCSDPATVRAKDDAPADDPNPLSSARPGPALS